MIGHVDVGVVDVDEILVGRGRVMTTVRALRVESLGKVCAR